MFAFDHAISKSGNGPSKYDLPPVSARVGRWPQRMQRTMRRASPPTSPRSNDAQMWFIAGHYPRGLLSWDVFHCLRWSRRVPLVGSIWRKPSLTSSMQPACGKTSRMEIRPSTSRDILKESIVDLLNKYVELHRIRNLNDFALDMLVIVTEWRSALEPWPPISCDPQKSP